MRVRKGLVEKTRVKKTPVNRLAKASGVAGAAIGGLESTGE